MKKTVLITALIVFMSGSAHCSYAGQKEWATAGKILAGAAGLAVLGSLADCGSRTYAYTAPRGIPVAQYGSRPHESYYSHNRKGSYVTTEVRHWVPGGYNQAWVDPVYTRRWNGFCYEQVLIEPGHYETVYYDGHYEYSTVSQWEPCRRKFYR